MRWSLFSRVETSLGRFAWWQVLLGGVAVGLATSSLVWFTVAGYIQIHDGPFNWRELAGDFSGNLPAELVFFLVTVFVIDRLNRGRQRQELRQELKEQLIRKMGSKVNDVALPAVDELRAYEWLTDGSLEGKNLASANLEGAPLRLAVLRDVYFGWANLRGAHLFGAKLEGAILINADLQGATFYQFSDGLQDAHIQDATGEVIESPVFSEKTVLPDGTRWALGTDLDKFTNPTHHEFWRSDDRDSPAYGGDDDQQDAG